ncbi:MAG: hypothetical protein HZA61_15595 [Candidatus Eisenbacteria bacterium]|uniref:Uncharacterized protein n=1 Tax=Eiseniibacteriota bacterium TaxID=2212470 RepID=A0A933SFR3_UNCEI|nr:hypothetical protein [Candidatus Eisenbacteria bacterium]
MNVFEQLALGAQCPWRTLREAGRAELWRPWARYLLACVLVLFAIGFAPHPALSWFMAPLVRWASGDDALRYPELYARLPGLWKWAQLVLDAAVAPFAAGVAALLWSERFRGAPLHAREARALMWRHRFALLAASAPVTLVTVLGHVGLGALEQVRLSGLSRSLAPQALAALVFFVKAACFYAVPMVMLDPRGSRRALFALPRTWAHGLLPALVASAALSLLALPLQVLLSRPAALVAVLPEGVLLVAVANAAVRVGVLGLAAGAGTLLYLSALVPGEDDR